VLNELQVRVLRWIADGCPDGVFDGYEHRVSAAALRTRGLVQISGRGPTWSATMTESGKRALDGGEVRAPADSERERTLSATEQLIADVIAAGGTLRVPAYRGGEGRNYPQLVRAAQYWRKIPEGKRLQIVGVGLVETEIRLVDGPPATDIASGAVPVPQRLTKPHPVAAAFRNDTERHEVARANIARATRVVHAIAVEGGRRGYEVAPAPESQAERGRDRWTASNHGHLVITIRGHSYRLRISEEKVKTRGPWEMEVRHWADVPFPQNAPRNAAKGAYDAKGTGRLAIVIDGGYARQGRQATFADRRSWTLEERLPDLFRELEIRSAEDDYRDLERKREAEERQRRWELAMEEARMRFVEAKREAALTDQLTNWQRAEVASRYLDVLLKRFPEAPETQELIAWLRDYIERIDPLTIAPRLPEIGEIKSDELRPFLGNLSPYGPGQW
jgi:hypothetical protein